MPHDIIDNQEQKLSDHIGRLLDNSERAKIIMRQPTPLADDGQANANICCE